MRKKIKNKIKRIIHLTALISFIIISVIDNCYEYFYFTPRLEKGIDYLQMKDYENTLNIVAEYALFKSRMYKILLFPIFLFIILPFLIEEKR